MKPKLRIYHDDGGHLRCDCDEDIRMLGWFIEQDVQNSQPSCNDYIEMSMKVIQGDLPEWGGVGNAFSVTV